MGGPRIAELKRELLGAGGEQRQKAFGRFFCNVAYNAKLKCRDRVRRVNVGDIGFEAWENERLERLLSLPKDKFMDLLEKKPPILTGFRLRDGSAIYFVMIDGNHRVAAAHELGVVSIPCRGNLYDLLPKRTVILEPVHQKLLKGCRDAKPLIIESYWESLNIEKRLTAQIVVAMGAREARYL